MLNREERRRELQRLLLTPSGMAEIEELFFDCFPPGEEPPVGTLVIETILDKEAESRAA